MNRSKDLSICFHKGFGLKRFFFDFVNAEEAVFHQWKHAATTEEREQVWLTKLGLEAFHEFFQTLLIDGKLAEKDLQDKQIRGNL